MHHNYDENERSNTSSDNIEIIFFEKKEKIVPSLGLMYHSPSAYGIQSNVYQSDLVKLALEGIVECVKVTANDERSLP